LRLIKEKIRRGHQNSVARLGETSPPLRNPNHVRENLETVKYHNAALKVRK